MWLIVGLGNPGKEYEGTRHNVGFEVVELLAKRHQVAIRRRSMKAVLGESTICGQKVIIARPMTYMNLSGDAVQPLAQFYKIPLENIVIVLDDVALPVGRLRLRFQGSAGGQNGLKHIILRMGTDAIQRIRLGVGGAHPGGLVGHVLSKFDKDERDEITACIERAADAIECMLEHDFLLAMNRFNPS